MALTLFASVAWAAEPGDTLTEPALVRVALEGPVLQAQLNASRARVRATGAPSPVVPNPVLEGRHEQANGPAGASTDAIGGTLTIDLGLSGLGERRAATLRAQAAEARLHADALDAVCAVRADALDLWLAAERVEIASLVGERLTSLLDRVGGLARAGEASGYDRDRTALAVTTQRAARDATLAEVLRARAALSTLVGRPIAGVELSPTSALGPLDVAVEHALAADPTLVALRGERDAAAVSLAAARRAAVPALDLYGGARWDALPDGTERTPGFEVGAAVEVPLLDRNQASTSAARAALSQTDAEIARRQAEIRARVQTAWTQVDRLGEAPAAVEAEVVWTGALARYSGGEAPIHELLDVARDVEAAQIAVIHGIALRRRAHLDLACAAGRFAQPELQALLEESLR